MSSSLIPSHLKIDFRPQAAPQAVVTGPNVRFSLLTSRLIRMEYSPSGEFEDHASQAFWYRGQPVPAFTVESSDARIEISHRAPAPDLYRPARPGSASAPSRSKCCPPGMSGATAWSAAAATWAAPTAPWMTPTAASAWSQGLMSRDGWAVVDDSKTLVFDEHGWIARAPTPKTWTCTSSATVTITWAACAISPPWPGEVPLVPRWALGNWWSRYWEYTQEELPGPDGQSFKARGMPLSVCVIDMDWHITQTGNSSTGWTGYTWNRELFPDPAGFLAGAARRRV